MERAVFKKDKFKKYRYAKVLVNVGNIGARTFVYLIEESLSGEIMIGQKVLVPFGSIGNISAFVVGFSNYVPEGIRVKSIVDILEREPLFSLEYLEFLNDISKYYCCSLQSVLKMVLPSRFFVSPVKVASLIESVNLEKLDSKEYLLVELLKKRDMKVSTLQKRLKMSSEKFYRLINSLKVKGIVRIDTNLEKNKVKEKIERYVRYGKSSNENYENLTKRQIDILEYIKLKDEVEIVELKRELKTTAKMLEKLKQLGCIDIFEKKVYRDSIREFSSEGFEFENSRKVDLWGDQINIFERIESRLEENELNNEFSNALLLHGITGSGKTQIYFKLIEQVIKRGKNVLFLVPEIALASQLMFRFLYYFGYLKDNIGLWHSNISDGQRYDLWKKLKLDGIRILIGVRSAVFAPLRNIGLIIIDEEHENSYKQTSTNPRYDARFVAKKLCELNKCSLVKGSATPDIKSYYEAKNTGNLYSLKVRYKDALLGKVVTIDMNESNSNSFGGYFSQPLINSIKEVLYEKKQVILLINRRGYTTVSKCVNCGHIIKCDGCDIPLIYHKSDNKLRCHWCGNERIYSLKCEKCGNDTIKSFGVGSERIEQIVSKLFPEAKVRRLDSDIMAKSSVHHLKILKDFQEGKIDILVGTQMIAKGLDNENVVLSAMINADDCFNLPDFRSQERGFQLLTQLAGRVGRGKHEGRVYFQTYNPDFFVLNYAKSQDYVNFYNSEIDMRESFDYPPFSNLIRVVIQGENKLDCKCLIETIVERLKVKLKESFLDEHILICGPSACIFEKISNVYRFHFMIKNKLSKRGHQFICNFLNIIKLPKEQKMIIDVDPVDIL